MGRRGLVVITNHEVTELCSLAGSLLIKNGRLEEAEEVYLGLLRRNPENHGYYSKLETASGCETTEQKLDMYARMREQFPKAQAPQRLPLNFAKGWALDHLCRASHLDHVLPACLLSAQVINSANCWIRICASRFGRAFHPFLSTCGLSMATPRK